MGYLEDNNIDYPENDTFIPHAIENFSQDSILLEIGAGLHSTRVFDVTIIVDDIGRDWKERKVVSFLKEKGYSCKNYEKFAVCEPQ